MGHLLGLEQPDDLVDYAHQHAKAREPSRGNGASAK
jgi:hypothetical protein